MDPTSGHIHLEVGKTDVGFKPKPQHVWWEYRGDRNDGK
jgi:hypothetical protein